MLFTILYLYIIYYIFQGSDHGFFDTAGEDGGNFSDELDGAGGGSDEGYLDHPSQSQHSQMCLPNGKTVCVCVCVFVFVCVCACPRDSQA